MEECRKSLLDPRKKGKKCKKKKKKKEASHFLWVYNQDKDHYFRLLQVSRSKIFFELTILFIFTIAIVFFVFTIENINSIFVIVIIRG